MNRPLRSPSLVDAPQRSPDEKAAAGPRGESALRHRLCRLLMILALGAPVVGSPARADTSPAFDEVFSLVESNLAGATGDALNELAVRGLLEQLSPRVVLVDNPTNRGPVLEAGERVRSRIYRDNIGYIRMETIESGAGAALWRHYLDMGRSNGLSGLVLDVREAAGEDYAAALAVADRFLTEEVPLVNWGEGLRRSTVKQEAIMLPVAVLVDTHTGGSAEALAAMLRLSGVALLIGEQTAGTAGIQRAFPLENGQYLRITVANIQLGDARLIPTTGLKPDVEVAPGPGDRRAALQDTETAGAEAKEAAGNGNAPAPMNEADLMRRWRGEVLAVEDAASPATPETSDPVLLRALDLMDGLAILRSWQK